MAKEHRPPTSFLFYRETCELIRRLAPHAAIVTLGWFLVLIVRALAGRLTYSEIEILVGTLGEASGPVPAWGVAIAAIVYGYLQRREKLRKTENLQGRITELETRIDPNRSSSGLLKDGTTNPEDHR